MDKIIEYILLMKNFKLSQEAYIKANGIHLVGRYVSKYFDV